MRVSEVMTSNVERLPLDTSLSEAGMKMREHDIGAIPVYEGDRLVGMITDRDIAIRAVAEGKNPGEVTVRQAMSPGIAYCFEDQDIRGASASLALSRWATWLRRATRRWPERRSRPCRRKAGPRSGASPRSEAMAGGSPRPPQRRTHASRAG